MANTTVSSAATYVILPIVAIVVAILLWLVVFRGHSAPSPPSLEMAPGAPSTPLPPPVAELQTENAPVAGGIQIEVDPQERKFAKHRGMMVERQLKGRDITDQRVLEAMQKVPRHEFVPKDWRAAAYTDRPLPIGQNQTISQPYIVALMTQLVQPAADTRALDVGTGSGYQAAVLAELVEEVYSIEILCPLADEARERLKTLGYKNVEVRCGDGYRGWPEHAPFDVIIVAAAPDHIPQPLIDQLAPGGRLVIPVGNWYQNLIVVEKQPDGSLRRKNVAPVAFVPMTGEAQEKK